MVGVQGEYRDYDVGTLPEASEESFTFVCPTASNLMLRLKSDRKMLVDGHVIEEPLVVATFKDFMFTTTDPAIAAMIRSKRAFKRGVVRDLEEVKEATKVARKEKIASELLADPELLAEVLGALRPGKASTPTVAAAK